MPAGLPDLKKLLKGNCGSKVPRILCRAIYVIFAIHCFIIPFDLQLLELFCGQMAITKAFQIMALRAIPFDKDLSRRMDINQTTGFIVALATLLRLEPLGLLWLAPLCGSWVMINLGTSMRSILAPFGDHLHHDYIAQANLQVHRA